ncbi:hypothetical protein [Paenibacillus durus]|uniref:Uncharacterized protein n=1 Tax=Paenibacillus durus ATCC 35681 TaxID=1333534 RepID=A0A0F7F8I2_PAEDU|nr:hypothetical protein [Paenibacillus durus]AKG34667.1 hypothetical protein VK70_08825 [Paenibacillus durus ATCC 35681]
MASSNYHTLVKRMDEFERRLNEIQRPECPPVFKEDGGPWRLLRAQLQEQLSHVQDQKRQPIINAVASLIRCATGVPRVQQLAWEQIEHAKTIIHAVLTTVVTDNGKDVFKS